MAVMTAKSNLAVKKLFEDWGFEEEKIKGAHLTMRHVRTVAPSTQKPTGGRVQITAPGPGHPTPHIALRKAAKLIDVPLWKFKEGPEKPAKLQVEQPPLEVLSGPTAEILGAAQPEPAKSNGSKGLLMFEKIVAPPPPPLPEPEPELAAGETPWTRADDGSFTRVAARFQAAPGVEFRATDMAKDCEIDIKQAQNALSYLARDSGTGVKRLSRGVYVFGDTKGEENVPPPVHRRVLPEPSAVATTTHSPTPAHPVLEPTGARWRLPGLGPSARILARMQAAPGVGFDKERLMADCDLTDSQAAAALNYVHKTETKVERLRHGVYFYDDSVRQAQLEAQAAKEAEAAAKEAAIAEARARREAEEAELAAAAKRLADAAAAKAFQRVAEDRFGRVVLSDPQGDFWVAIRVEPGHYAMA